MRRLLLVFLFSLITNWATAVSAADRTSFGLGLGALYNGLGANVAWTSPDDMKFVSAGVSGYIYSSHGDDTAVFGIGAGWLKTDILTGKNNKHGLGINLALDYYQRASKIEPAIRIPYVFFFNGVDQKGLNLGIAPFVRWSSDNSTDFGALIQIGYQF